MAYKVQWSIRAQNDLKALDSVVARRILKKLKWVFNQEDALAFARRLEHSSSGDARFRIGDYRVIISVGTK